VTIIQVEPISKSTTVDDHWAVFIVMNIHPESHGYYEHIETAFFYPSFGHMRFM